ncbi:MAG: hypothetical protein ACRDP1_04610 [Nocardioidaceae bacterium]
MTYSSVPTTLVDDRRRTYASLEWTTIDIDAPLADMFPTFVMLDSTWEIHSPSPITVQRAP